MADARRLELHEKLCEILGSRNVYFQPPESIKMKYPCIRYERSGINTEYADNKAYRKLKQYTITVIDRDPDSELIDRVLELPFSSFSRHYVADNLNHDVSVLYY